MVVERENDLKQNQYGTLTMRPYDISGNIIDAFYDSENDLVFVLDKTLDSTKTNVLLVINPDSDKKWDEILSGKYGVDLESVRPKQDNKYQKLDIEYSGLSVYENLIRAYESGDKITDLINQLNILRNSAVRHSAMMRLNAANDTIATTNVTIVKTKESIVRLNARLKTLRSNLADMKKEIGREPTKKSAAKILRAESQMDTTKEKIKRAQKRLESAQKRLEVAMVDAELAGNLLNQPAPEMKNEDKSVAVAADSGAPVLSLDTNDKNDKQDANAVVDVDESLPALKIDEDADEAEKQDSSAEEIKPLFDEDPEIIDEDIAFKPISFDVPDLPAPVVAEESRPELAAPTVEVEEPKYNTTDESVDTKEEFKEEIKEEIKEEEVLPVLESLTPIRDDADENDNRAEESHTDTEGVAPESEENDAFKPVNVSGLESETVEEMPVVPVVESQEIIDPDDIKTEPEKAEEEFESGTEKVRDDLVRPAMPMMPNNIGNSGGVAPVAPVVANYDTEKSRPTFLYYLLLLILICASVFALWLYQKNMGNGNPWFFVSKSGQTEVVEPAKPAPTVQDKPIVQKQPIVERPAVVQEKPAKPVVKEPVAEQPAVQQKQTEPLIMNTVSARVSAFVPTPESDVIHESGNIVHQAAAEKPVYGAGSKYDEMFVYEEDQVLEEPDDNAEVEYDEPYVEPVGFQESVEYPVVEYTEPVISPAPVEEAVPAVVESEPQVTEPADNNVVYYYDDQEYVYPDGGFYDDYVYDPEEEAYQAGDDGYDEY